MRIKTLMQENKENIGMAGLSLAIVMAATPEIIQQIVIGIGVPLFVLIVGHFVKAGLNRWIPLNKKTKEDTELTK